MPVPFSQKSAQLDHIKKCVARKAWELFIQPDRNPRILIDAGSSAKAVADVIHAKLRELGDEAVVPTVFTHNLAAWEVLAQSEPKVDLYLIGGRYTPDLNAVIEQDVYEGQLEKWTPNISIIAVSGIDSKGVYCSNIQDEALVKGTLTKKEVEKRIIVCDHSKIAQTDVKKFSSLEDLKELCKEVYLVTDRYDWKQVQPEYLQDDYKKTLERLEDLNCNVIEVDIGPEGDSTIAS